MPSPAISIKQQYESGLSSGELRPDTAQTEAVGILQALAEELKGYRPACQMGFLARLFGKSRQPPKGLYLYGDVGRGKSMLMDLFFDQISIAKKRRVHFHQFMLEVHSRLHKLQIGPEESEGILPRVARDLSNEAWLLCFDEFHISNIADAMILGRLFGTLFDLGVVIVATSNWPPDDLYKNGLQRDRFLSSIGLIKQHMNVHNLNGKTDHRYETLRGTPNYFTPLSAETTDRLKKIFLKLSGGVAGHSLALPVQGRSVDVPYAAKDVALFTFDQLCNRPLAAADYLAIAECFSTVLIDGVPLLTPERRNETVRFTVLIDAFYEMKVKVYIGAAAMPDQLCKSGELAFDFQRTTSRLVEMQSEEYRQKAHLE